MAREAVEILEPSGDSHELGIAYGTVGRLAVSAGLRAEVRVASGRALEIGRRLGDPEVTAIALANIGTMRGLEGGEDGLADLRRSLAIGRQADPPRRSSTGP